MDFYENVAQLMALVGFDEEGQRTVIALCTESEIEKTVTVIFESWTQTTVVLPFEVELRGKSLPGEEYIRSGSGWYKSSPSS